MVLQNCWTSEVAVLPLHANLSSFLRRLAPHRAPRKLASEPQLCPVLGEGYPGSAYESCRHLAFRVLTSLYLGFLALGRCYLVPPFPAALSAPISRFGGHLSPYEDYQARYTYMPFGILASGLCGTASQCWSLRFLSVLRQSVADTLALNPQRHIDFLPSSLSGSESRPIISAPLRRERMVLWLRGLLLKHWRLLCHDPAPAAFGLVAAHSLKCTLLSWARQLHLDSDLRRIQGHHRQSGSDRSVSLYSRDDILPMLRLQRLVVDAVRSGFRPLQPMARGLSQPLPDFPVTLPSAASLPELGPLSDDCLPEALPSRPCLPVVPSEPLGSAGASQGDADLESLSSESSESSGDEAPLQDVSSGPTAPKATAPPPSASVTAFGFLWNARNHSMSTAPLSHSCRGTRYDSVC